MKQHVESLLQMALRKLQEANQFSAIPAFIQVTATKDKQHGDFASNIAMILAKTVQKKPRDIAHSIIQVLPASPYLLKVEIADPGFINFFLSPQAFNNVVAKILTEKENYGRTNLGRNKRILIEFVSSNPTGPLHVGHGRHAAFGDIVANLLEAVGFKTYREYYVNDAGRQVDILTVSVWLRYLMLCGEIVIFPRNAYCGDYVIDIATLIHAHYHTLFHLPAEKIFEQLPTDDAQEGDKETYIDVVIAGVKQLLGDRYALIYDFSLNHILRDIREDLAEFGVQYDNWFSEREKITADVVQQFIKQSRASDYSYEQDGALWFRTTQFGDEKDRVLIRSNGQRTYFANDVAYHLDKFERDFDIAIDIFGADHHGYVPRMKAALEAFGINPERLIHLLVQFVTLYRHGQQVQMSTRDGNFVTLRDLRREVGNDAARFFYVMRKSEQHIDFDLDIAKKRSNENPVYYIQYAHARICSVLKQVSERGMHFDETHGLAQLHLLDQINERQLLNTLSHYPDTIMNAALHYEPHLLTNYVRELAGDFHTYYNACQFLVDDSALRDARLALISAVKQVICNSCRLLGVTTPESM